MTFARIFPWLCMVSLPASCILWGELFPNATNYPAYFWSNATIVFLFAPVLYAAWNGLFVIWEFTGVLERLAWRLLASLSEPCTGRCDVLPPLPASCQPVRVRPSVKSATRFGE